MIYCHITKKAYIGSSGNIYMRLSGHRAELNGNRHQNQKLQNAYNKYGRNNFCFVMICQIVDSITEQELVDKENFYLEGCNKELLLNIQIPATVGGMPGFKHSEETRVKMAESHKRLHEQGYVLPWKGKPLSEERKAEISKFMKGHKFNTPEVIAKINAATKGKRSRKGEVNGRCKLTAQQVEEIKGLLREGNLSQEKIGKMYGVGQDAISKIKLGKLWKHLPK